MGFSLKDQSNKPYAWMIEGVDLNDLAGSVIEEYVLDYVRTSINATNYSDQTDDEVFATWLESGELDEAAAYIASVVNETDELIAFPVSDNIDTRIVEEDMVLSAGISTQYRTAIQITGWPEADKEECFVGEREVEVATIEIEQADLDRLYMDSQRSAFWVCLKKQAVTDAKGEWHTIFSADVDQVWRAAMEEGDDV